MGDLTIQSALHDNLVPPFNGTHHFLMLSALLLLRTNHQKIHDPAKGDDHE